MLGVACCLLFVVRCLMRVVCAFVCLSVRLFVGWLVVLPVLCYCSLVVVYCWLLLLLVLFVVSRLHLLFGD